METGLCHQGLIVSLIARHPTDLKVEKTDGNVPRRYLKTSYNLLSGREWFESEVLTLTGTRLFPGGLQVRVFVLTGKTKKLLSIKALDQTIWTLLMVDVNTKLKLATNNVLHEI